MALQIKKKNLGSNQVDGSKILLAQGQAIRGIDSNGVEKDLVELSQTNEVLVDGKAITFKEVTDVIQSDLDAAEQNISDLESDLSAEVSRAEGQEAAIRSEFAAADVSAVAEAKSYTDSKVSLVLSNLDTAALDSLVEVVSAFEQADQNLNTAITSLATELDQRIDQIVDIDLGTIGSRLTNAEMDIDSLEGRMLSAEGNITSEVSRATFEEGLLKSRMSNAEMDIDSLEGRMLSAEGNINSEVSRATFEEGLLKSRMTNAEMDIDSLEGRMLSAEGNISSEVSRATFEEDLLKGRMTTAEMDIDSLEGRMLSAEGNISGEVTRATFEENQLKSRMTTAEMDIDSVEGRMLSAEGNISAEVTRATNAETELQSNIDDVEGYAQDIRSDLDDLDGYAQDVRSDLDQEIEDRESAVSAEETARIAGDADLQSQIDALSGGGSGSISALQTEINNTQVGAGLESDGSYVANPGMIYISTATSLKEATEFLDDNLSGVNEALQVEISDRVSGDTSVYNDAVAYTDQEIASVQSQINNVLSNVDESALDSLTEIVSAFQAADASLNGAITSLSTGLSAEIDAEEAARIAADSALQGEIDAEEIARAAADVTLQNNINSGDATTLQSAKDYTDAQVQSSYDSAVNYVDTEFGSLSQTVNENYDNSFLINGSRGMEGNILMGDESGTMYKISALADGVSAHDAVNKGQLSSGVQEAKDYADQQIAAIPEVDLSNYYNKQEVDSGISTEQSRAQSAENLLSIRLDTAENSISQEVFDRQTAITSVEGQVQAEQDRAEVAEQQLSQEIFRVESDLGEQIVAEQNRAYSAEQALGARIVPMEEILEFEKAVVFNDNAQVYADAQPGSEDEAQRPGWYFQNKSAGQKINWYFFDGVNQANISLGDFSAYAVMTFDSVSPVKSPIMAVYTMPTGTNDIMPGFAHSRVVYNGLSATPVAGKKYLVYFGQNPSIHPELPRLQLSVSAGNSVGEKLPTERVLTTSFGSNSGDAINTVKFMVESLGLHSPSFKAEVELKIPVASLAKLETEISERQAADTALDLRLDALEAKGFSKGSFVIGEELAHVDLDREYATVLTVSVGRLMVHEGEDYTVSVVGGVTRLTWIGSLVSPSGAEAIEAGDKVFWSGSY